jgi:hypothetical protein
MNGRAMKPRIAASIARNPASLLVICDDFFKSDNNTFKKGPITRSTPSGPWKISECSISLLIVKKALRGIAKLRAPCGPSGPLDEEDRIELRHATRARRQHSPRSSFSLLPPLSLNLFGLASDLDKDDPSTCFGEAPFVHRPPAIA